MSKKVKYVPVATSCSVPGHPEGNVDEYSGTFYCSGCEATHTIQYEKKRIAHTENQLVAFQGRTPDDILWVESRSLKEVIEQNKGYKGPGKIKIVEIRKKITTYDSVTTEVNPRLIKQIKAQIKNARLSEDK